MLKDPLSEALRQLRVNESPEEAQRRQSEESAARSKSAAIDQEIESIRKRGVEITPNVEALLLQRNQSRQNVKVVLVLMLVSLRCCVCILTDKIIRDRLEVRPRL